MKVHIKGDTPMERLTNLTKRVVSVPKIEIEKLESEWRTERKRRKRRKSR